MDSRVAVLECRACGRVHLHCVKHLQDVMVMMRGHVLRVHPELVPDVVAKWRADPKLVAELRARAAESPELWSKLLAAVEGS